MLLFQIVYSHANYDYFYCPRIKCFHTDELIDIKQPSHMLRNRYSHTVDTSNSNTHEGKRANSSLAKMCSNRARLTVYWCKQNSANAIRNHSIHILYSTTTVMIICVWLRTCNIFCWRPLRTGTFHASISAATHRYQMRKIIIEKERVSILYKKCNNLHAAFFRCGRHGNTRRSQELFLIHWLIEQVK